jgi:ClpP class serine protease
MISRIVNPGELLAVADSAVRRGADGFFFMFGSSVPPNERHAVYSDVAIVHVRGALDHHETSGLDNYEAITKRVAAAFADGPVAVVLCIDSRGGSVAGMAEGIASIRALRSSSGIPLIAYVNETAASAAYALACACDKIACPRSADLGSIGTIAMMGSQYEADRENGVDVRLITSGARKADGNPHAPISDDAVAAEQARVDASAQEFFRLAANARGMKVSAIEALEAGLFRGPQAYAIGLADIVCSLDALCRDMSEIQTQLDEPAQLAQHGTSEGSAMNIKALITKTEALLASATDPHKKARLEADLAAFKLTSLRAESDKDDDCDDDDDGDDKAKKAKAAADKAARKAVAMKHRAKAAEFKQKAKDCEDEAKKAMADDDGGEDAIAADTSTALTPGAAAALAGQTDIAASNSDAIAALQARLDTSDRLAMVESAYSGRRVTPAERKTLLEKPIAFVRDFLAMRPKAIVQAAGDELPVPPMSAQSPITATMRAELEAEVAKLQASGSKITIESAQAALEKSLNGKAPVV